MPRAKATATQPRKPRAAKAAKKTADAVLTTPVVPVETPLPEPGYVSFDAMVAKGAAEVDRHPFAELVDTPEEIAILEKVMGDASRPFIAEEARAARIERIKILRAMKAADREFEARRAADAAERASEADATPVAAPVAAPAQPLPALVLHEEMGLGGHLYLAAAHLTVALELLAKDLWRALSDLTRA